MKNYYSNNNDGCKGTIKFAIQYKEGRKYQVFETDISESFVRKFDSWGVSNSGEQIFKGFFRQVMGWYHQPDKYGYSGDSFILFNYAIKLFVKEIYPHIKSLVEDKGDRNIRVISWLEY